MDNFLYPNKDSFKLFIEIIITRKFHVIKYLPHIDEEWYRIISECVDYVRHTANYESCKTVEEAAARLLYKVAKRHELGDGNKRSAVIVVYLFCILNNFSITSPQKLKIQAKRLAATKGRLNEDIIRKRTSKKILEILEPLIITKD